MLDRDPWGQIRSLPRILKESTMTDTETAADVEARVERVDMSMAKTLQRSIEINRDLRRALEEAAQRLEARGHNFGASEARRVLRDT